MPDTELIIGHLGGTHSVDKTASDVEKSLRMAWSTYRAIDDYAQLICNCRANGWDSEIESTVRAFSEVGTFLPGIADIDGETGIPRVPRNFDLADPYALQKKAAILGF